MWHQETDEEDGKNEEKQDPEESLLDCCWNVLPWVLGLSSSNTNKFGSLVRKACLDERSPEADELPECGLVSNNVGSECSRIAPSMESKIAVLACSCVNADSENQESDDGQDLNRRKPELELAVETDRQEVKCCDDDPEDRDKDSDVELGCPILDNEASGSEFK